MASTSQDHEHDGPSKRQSTSDESAISEPVPEPSVQPLQRQSSIRFSEDSKKHSQSPMSNVRRTASDTDEATPIRHADGHASRMYNTQSATSISADGQTEQHQEPSERQNKPKASWWKNIAEKYGSVSLENKGSVARDHLALERTFLAWLRTSLAFASIGIAITQLFRLNTTIQSRQQQSIASLSMRSDVPFSPLVGQSLPPELLPYIQEVLASASASAVSSIPTLGPTLLDQLLLLGPLDGNGVQARHAGLIDTAEFDEGKATKLRHVGKPLGATFLGISIIILFIGFHRYFESQHWIMKGKFPASRGSIFIVAFITGSLIVASLAVVLAIAPTSFEKKK